MAPTNELPYKKYLKLIIKKRRLFVMTALLIMTGMIIYGYNKPERYVARCTVFIEKSVISGLVQGLAMTPSFEDKIRGLTYAIKSRALLLNVMKDMGLKTGKGNEAQQEMMVKAFQDATEVSLKDKEGLFTISYSSENPAFARDYVNTLVRRYIQENMSSKVVESQDASALLSEQIAVVKAKLDKAETMMNFFKSEKGPVLAESEQGIVREISDAQLKLDDLAIKRNQLEALRSMDPLSARLAGLEKRLEELNLVYTENYPEVISVRNELESVRREMKSGKTRNNPAAVDSQEVEKINTELKAVRASEQNLKRFIASRRASMQNIPTTRASLEALEQERYTQKNLYEQLMARHHQAEVSKQVEVQDKANTFRIVDPAIMPMKMKSDRVRMILLGVLGGLAGSFALLVLLDYLDNSVRDVDALKSLGVAVLAVVPKIQDLAQLEALRRRDIRFFIYAGAYFALILATLAIETLRNFSFEVVDPAQITQNLSQLKNVFIK